MSMTLSRPYILFPTFLLLIALYALPTHAFGAGNIASTARIEGTNWRHGDIEDTLLTLLTARAYGGAKFSKLDVKRVYFGNWLRDYSQAVDVGTVKYVSAEAIRILLWILGFLSFGYGTGEFEVTRDRLGCYRPEEHIDNPKDYADNLDARQYDRRLRGPVDERRELSIDERTGLKKYIATEDAGITTSAGLVRNLFGRSIELGRQYARSGNKADFYEALRLLGTGCHCLEDYSAHSNYTELALIELGEQNVFPHVGRRTQMRVRGARQPIFPIVTGTFGGVDFLHSVMGEFSDKATQSELQELEGTIQNSQNQDTSLLKNLLNQVPSGLLGGKDQAGRADELQANAQAAHMQNLNISPRNPEAITQQIDELTKQIYPVLQFHDEIMKSITEAVEKIPILPDLIEQITDQINIFVFSLLAPFVLPIIKQVKRELATGSSEIIQSSKDKQLIVFHDDNSTDPTHSMLSKDHFSNVLNEPAGKIASQVLKWVVPQIVACWDDRSIPVDRTLDRIVNGVFHHPALRESGNDGAMDGRRLMFGVVHQWWGERSERERVELRDKLSRNGVEAGRNHKEGVHDSGHGCGKPLGLPGMKTASSSGAPGGSYGGQAGRPASNPAIAQVGNLAGEAIGGGVLGSIVGGLVGGVGANLLGSAFSGATGAQTQTFQNQSYNQDGSYTSSVTETGHRTGHQGQQERYGQAEYKTTQFPGGGHREEYQRYEQDGRTGATGYGFQQRTDVVPTSGGGYEQRSERRYERPGGQWESEVQQERVDQYGGHQRKEEKHHGKKYDEDESEDSDEGDSWEKKQRKREKKERRNREEEERERKKREKRNSGGGGYGGYGGDGGDSDEEKRHRQGMHGHEERRHEREQEYGSTLRADERLEHEHQRKEEYGGRKHGGYGDEVRSDYGEAERFGELSQRQDQYGQPSYGRHEEPRRERLTQDYPLEQPAYGSGYMQEQPAYGGIAGGSGYARRPQPSYGGRDEQEPSYGRGYEQPRRFGEAGYGEDEGGYVPAEEGQMPGAFGEEDEFPEAASRRQRGGYGGGGGW
ncbi:hypothetical protein LTR66_010827 [Elasticomyces elasticus]|nr:hypothetical protein LTR66_010827 [Elasticomyces elasticus]